MNKAQPHQTRRTFLINLARGALAAGLALLGFKLVGSSFFRKKGGQSCTSDFICSRCSAYPSCGLPPALSRKRARRRITTPAAQKKG
jgi:hypothetical protein